MSFFFDTKGEIKVATFEVGLYGEGAFAGGRLLGSTRFARTPGGADGAGSRGAIAETSTAGEKASGRLPLRRLFASAEFSVSGVGRPVHEGLSPAAAHAYYLLTTTYLGHISRGPRSDTTSCARLISKLLLS